MNGCAARGKKALLGGWLKQGVQRFNHFTGSTGVQMGCLGLSPVKGRIILLEKFVL